MSILHANPRHFDDVIWHLNGCEHQKDYSLTFCDSYMFILTKSEKYFSGYFIEIILVSAKNTLVTLVKLSDWYNESANVPTIKKPTQCFYDRVKCL